MRVLLDTHIALWAIARPAKLPGAATSIIGDPDNEIFVSAASIWEISIKHALPRGATMMPVSGEAALGYFRQAGYQLFNISPQHAAAAGALPLLHGDPFDRMLVAQAMHEPMRLLTHDRQVAAYDPAIILV